MSQKSNTVRQSMKQDFCKSAMTLYKNPIKNPRLLFNIDETAVYASCATELIVHNTGKKTVSIRVCGTLSKRLTLDITEAMYGIKLPLFAIFLGQHGGVSEKILPNIMSDGVIGCSKYQGGTDMCAMCI